MMRRFTLGASIALFLACAWLTGSPHVATNVAAQTPTPQSSQPREQAPSNMQDMMKIHEQMMAEMKAADSRLDALVNDMNAATGDAKMNAVATVVTELVRQQSPC